MKFKAPSKRFYNLVSAISKVINSKNAITILNNFHFELADGELKIKASDTDNTLIGRMEVTDVEGEGSFCIDARRMVDMLKELPDQGISVEINDETFEVVVSYGTGVYSTMAIAGSEYPEFQPLDAESEENLITFTTTMEQVTDGIESTLFAVSTDDSHPQMTGILWDIHPDKIVFVATDTRKLVRYINSTSAPEVECSFILPYKAATILKNVFGSEELVNVALTPRKVKFETRNFVFDCVLIKGNYPDYNRVIPTGNPYTLTIDRASFLTAVRRVNSFVDANNGKITFKIFETNIVMRAQDSSFNTSGEESIGCTFDGDELRIAFSAPYLIEILNTLPAGDINIRLADQSRAAVIVPAENAEQTDLLMLLMPMYVQEF